MPVCSPCQHPAGILRSNPTSTEQAALRHRLRQTVAAAYDALQTRVPPDWLPALSNVSPMGEDLQAQLSVYGCGAYGCVFPTHNPTIVFKVTTDDTEAEFAGRLAQSLVAPICVRYYEVMEILASGEPTYFLWRESAQDVGDILRVINDTNGGGYDAQQLVIKAMSLIDNQHALAQDAYEQLFELQDRPGRPQPMRNGARMALSRWENACARMGSDPDLPELQEVATGMLRAFREQRIFFGDVHDGNLGQVSRDAADHWVITDPGHVAVIEDDI